MVLMADDIRFGTTMRLDPGLPGRGVHPSLALASIIDAIRRHAARGITVLRLPAVLSAQLRDGCDWQAMAAVCGECAEVIGQLGVRLSIHAEMHVVAAADDAAIDAASIAALVRAVEVLDALGATADGVVVAHLPHPASGRGACIARWYLRLSAPIRRRIAFEPVAAPGAFEVALSVHQRTGAPIVLDTLHLQLAGSGPALGAALSLALGTWPAGVRPKIHLSSQRTEAVPLPGARSARPGAPHPGQHADYCHPGDIAALAEAARGVPPFDVMIEARAGEQAVAQVRRDWERSRHIVGAR